MKKWYTAELGNDCAVLLRRWLKNKGITYEASACGTLEVPRTNFQIYMDEETCKLCQNFLDRI